MVLGPPKYGLNSEFWAQKRFAGQSQEPAHVWIVKTHGLNTNPHASDLNLFDLRTWKHWENFMDSYENTFRSASSEVDNTVSRRNPAGLDGWKPRNYGMFTTVFKRWELDFASFLPSTVISNLYMVERCWNQNWWLGWNQKDGMFPTVLNWWWLDFATIQDVDVETIIHW